MALLAKRNDSALRQRRGRSLSPFGDVASPVFDAFPEFSRLGRLLDSMMRSTVPLAMVAEEAFVPAVDVSEKDGSYVIEAALPGFPKEDVSVEVGSNQVTISGEYEEAQDDKQKRYSEMRRAAFTRTIVLPQEVDADRAQATFEDGILRITVPPVTPIANKKLEIQGASSSASSGTAATSGGGSAGEASGGSSGEPRPSEAAQAQR